MPDIPGSLVSALTTGLWGEVVCTTSITILCRAQSGQEVQPWADDTLTSLALPASQLLLTAHWFGFKQSNITALLSITISNRTLCSDSNDLQ